MSDPLTPDPVTTERQRIRNLIDQFAAGFHGRDEMPDLILATLDAERASRGSEDAASALSAQRAEVAEVARRMEVEFAYLEVTPFAYLEVTPGRVVSGGVAARTFRPMAATLRRLAKAEPEGESRG